MNVMHMTIETRTRIEDSLKFDQTLTPSTRKHLKRALGDKTKRTLITTKEACAILGCCSMTLYRMEKERNLIKAIRYSQRKLRWDKDEILDLLNNGIEVE